MRKLLIGIIIVLLLVPSVAPLSFGINIGSKDKTNEDLLLSDYYSVYSLEEIPEDIRPVISEEEGQDIPVINDVVGLVCF